MKTKISVAAKLVLSTLGLSAAAFAATPAYAQWYAGASVGRSDINFDNAAQADQFLDLGFTSASTTSSNRGTGYRAFGGYQLHKYIAAEIAYVDVGRFEARSQVTPTGVLTNATKIDGGEISIVGTLPIGERFGIFGRVGAFAAETRTTYVGTGSVITINGNEIQKSHRTNLSYGAGVNYNFNKNISVRADWSRFTKLGDPFTGGKTDANLYAVGLVYRF